MAQATFPQNLEDWNEPCLARTIFLRANPYRRGTPRSVCDQISALDSVDLYLSADPHSRVAVEALATTNRVVLAGEVRGPAQVRADDLIDEVVENVSAISAMRRRSSIGGKPEIDCHVHSHRPLAQGVDARGNG